MKLTEYLNSIGIDKPIKSVTGSLRIKESVITEIDLPKLQSIGDYLDIHNNQQLTQIDLPELQSVGYSLNISNNQQLKQIDLPELQSVGYSLNFYNNPRLKILNNNDYEDEIQIKQALKTQVGK